MSGNLALSDIVDARAIQDLVDLLHKLTGLPLGLHDVEGRRVAGAGWQDICTNYHRVHPETCRNCVTSDVELPADIAEGDYRLYKCRNNMWDVATPLIVDGRRVGTVFSGQFLFADEKPDLEFFRGQAARYGFPEAEYLAALGRVPRPTRDHVETTIKLCVALAQRLAKASSDNVGLSRTVAELERTQASLRESEGRVQRKLSGILSPDVDVGMLELSDIVNVAEVQEMMDRLHAVAPMPIFLIDVKGKVLAGSGWQDICTRFHRVHSATCRRCVESDTEYSTGIPAGEYRVYRCKNGMWSVATPVHMGGRHVGNLFSGQFFFAGEEPDVELFKAQAARFGFPERDYLEALGRAPRLSRAFVEAAMKFYIKLAQNLSQASWNTISLVRARATAQGANAELIRVNRALKARSRSEQALVRAVDKREYLDEVCRIIVEDCGYEQVFVGLAERDAEKNVRTAAYAGSWREDVESFRVSWGSGARGRGPTGAAIRTGKPVICRDVLKDPTLKPWRELARRRGFASAISLPLLADGAAFGALSIYTRDPEAFTSDEISLLSGLAGDLAFGIGALRMRAERKAAEARFQQAQKMEAVGLLAGGIAHDFNNILATIVGYNSLLLEGLKGGPLHGFSLEIKHSADMAAKLTQQLLGVSGNRGAQRRVLDPNSVITALGKMLRRLLGEKIHLVLELRGSWPLKMDSGQLEQIVMNMAVNARDAMPRGGRLTLATSNATVKRGGPKGGPAPGRYVCLAVGDNGVGMDAEVQHRIFEPFFTTKGPGRGTGLGLATVKSIADEYGGHITVRSRPGKGSVFRILLPSPPGGAERMSRGVVKKSQRGHETILIVEDNGSLMTVLTLALRRAGYAVRSARTAEEALEYCAKAKPHVDLLLTDVVLPGMDGPELAKRLKKDRPGLRCVYMSGYPGNALGPAAGYGGCVLLEKPFSPAQMLAAVRRVLDAAQGDLF